MDETFEAELTDIPQELLLTVQEHIVHWFAPMAIPGRDGAPPTPIGSGTFVTVAGQPYILTAAHVWIAIERAGRVLITFGEVVGTFNIEAGLFAPHLIGDGREHEWGPDLALLKLPPPQATAIAAKRNFLNLDLQAKVSATAAPLTKVDLVAVCGNVAEFSQIIHDDKGRLMRMSGEVLYSLADALHERDGHDYIDLGVDQLVAGVPRDFGGVSGGGLWQFTLHKSRATGELSWDGRRRLIGVAYWQSTPENNRCVVRCHGPRSLYDVAGKAWGIAAPAGG